MAAHYPIFISYRRSDLSLEAEWLHSLIRTFFGEGAAFFDKLEIAGGTRWDETLRTCVRSAKIVLVLIGPAWLKEQAPSGKRRLDHEDDWVRQEVMAAIASYEADPANVRIFPVLINGAALPPAEWLPEPMALLASFQLEAALRFDVRDYVDSAAAIHEFLSEQLSKLEAQGAAPVWQVTPFSRERVPNPYEIPGYQLPEELRVLRPLHPYKSLEYFSRADAAIFFGRHREIGELIDGFKKGRHFFRLFGQSGVGKSSLLFAGLLPRLEEKGWLIHYERRDPKCSVGRRLEAIVQGLAPGPDTDALVILDQLEEIIIHPSTDVPSELDDFAAAAARLSALNATRRKPLRAIWAYRKEYDVNIKAALRSKGVATAEYWLRDLDRAGLREAILGVTRNRNLQEEYRLEIQAGLADTILADLLDGGETDSVAPLLQVLMRKMWDRVSGASGARILTREAYQSCKSADLIQLLEDQLAALTASLPHDNLRTAVDSGLALDVLRRFVSAQDTALRLPEEDVTSAYDDPALVKRLLQGLVDHYLLVREDGARHRLAHDTIAKAVRIQYARSVLPAQRAARLLESKAHDIEVDPESVDFSRADLSTIEEGLSGMRRLLERESRAVALSRAKRLQEQQDLEERNRQLERSISNEREQATRACSNLLNLRANQEDDLTEAVRLAIASVKLAPTPAALRTLYGKFDRAYVVERAPLRHTLLPGRGHSVAVLAGGTGLLFSGDPNNSRLCYYDLERRASRWLPHTGAPVAEIVGSPLGLQALVRRTDASAHLIDVESGSVVGFEAPFEFEQAAFVPPDRRLLIHNGSRVSAFDPVTGARSEVLELPDKELIASFAASLDGKRLLLATRIKHLYEYELETAHLRALIDTDEIVAHVAFLNLRQVLLVDLRRGAFVLDLAEKTMEVLQAPATGSLIEGASLAAGAQQMVACTHADDAHIIRVWAGGLEFQLRGRPDDFFTNLVLAPPSGIVVAAGHRGVHLWQLGETMRAAFTGGEGARWIKASAASTEYVAVYADRLHWFDLSTREEVSFRTPVAADMNPRRTAVQDHVIACVGERGPLTWFDLRSKQQFNLDLPFDAEVFGVFGGAGAVWLADKDGGLHVCDLQLDEWRHHHLGQLVYELAFGPSDRLAIGLADGSVHIASVTAPTPAVRTFQKLSKALMCLVWSPDGEQLYAGGWNSFGVLARPEASSFSKLQHEHWTVGAAFSPDGALLVTSSQDGMVRIFDTASGEVVRSLSFGSDPGACHFTPDGKRLYIVLDASKDVAVWLLDGPAEIEARLEHWKVDGCSQRSDVDVAPAQPAAITSDDPSEPFTEDLPPLLNLTIGRPGRRAHG